jgi:hypothetical protein
MPFIIKAVIAFALSAIGLGVYQVPQPRPDMSSTTPTSKPYEAVGGYGQYIADLYRFVPPVTTTLAPQPVYKHGDCSWLPKVALQAGWSVHDLKQVRDISARESGCCPARIGGQRVLADCTPNGFAETTHMSDSGLMMINGVHWKRDHPQYDGLICKQMGICTQAPLLDALTNLRAARLLYEHAGWSPWSICHRDNTCK